MNMPITEASAQRGLWRLMLKLPALRGPLQMFGTKNDGLHSLFEAYGEATSALDALSKNPASDAEIVQEYRMVCSDIETEVLELCLILQETRLS